MKRAAGLFLLVGVIVVAVIASRFRGNAPGSGPAGSSGASGATNAALTLKGYIGGEKTNFLKDPEVVKLLQDRYSITVDASRRGSLEMVEDAKAIDQDFLWPSSQVALERYKETKRPYTQAEILFNSPIVLYSWDSVTQALIRLNIVKKENNAYYVVDFPKLIQLTTEGKTWKDIGLPQLYGKVVIYSTDPTVSNSGLMFAGLLANVLSGGQVVGEASLGKVLPTLRQFFDNQGFMEQSSDVIFTQFLNKGVGDKPIIVGYEAQLIEYSLASAQELKQRKDAVRVLYPRPTVWSSHPLIALNDKGRKLIEALQDKDIQALAWKKHGFRSASGSQDDVSALAISGVPESIEKVLPMPAPRVMDKIIQTLSGK